MNKSHGLFQYDPASGIPRPTSPDPRTFLEQVMDVYGTFLRNYSFVVDEVADGGPHYDCAVYFRNSDCKLQVYSAPRNGEYNWMLARLDSPNEFGSYYMNKHWFTIQRLSGRFADYSIEDFMAESNEPRSFGDVVEDMRDFLVNHFEAARDNLLAMKRPTT